MQGYDGHVQGRCQGFASDNVFELAPETDRSFSEAPYPCARFSLRLSQEPALHVIKIMLPRQALGRQALGAFNCSGFTLTSEHFPFYLSAAADGAYL